MAAHPLIARVRPWLVWITGILLYAGDFLIKRLPNPRTPLNVETWLDRLIPFVPLWAWVYLVLWLLYLFGAAGWYLYEHRQDWIQVRRLLFAALFMQFGAWVIHYFFPTYMPRPVLAELQTDPHLWLIERIYSTDPPTHALPSLHVASVTVVSWFFTLRGGWGRRLVSGVAVGLIALSTLYTKQHGVLDVIAGLAWGYLACWVGYYTGLAWNRLPVLTAALRG
ncbi:MAG: phosphatase PAP2 family protein [Bacteroidetes bacterium]|nr:phosphatase PAP2 family protein [Rhodothermia bacterium]MCS7155894.1 phosphatase PAP2 family protein [Bacteroidota bacterium]MCX7906005.1 phosphatase PAP2 family protein [Bacteroidota bacterium]MDW8138133.1 phosphatase PAP2 family protein [Bacteroidota bacterium]MDW8285817.1 phosphatase PAP2 family protein [Bacteroidota bacterium]